MAERVTLHRRRPRPKSSEGEPKQLYRYNVSCEDAQLLLEREDLTEQDIVDYLTGKSPRPQIHNEQTQKYQEQVNAYRARRKEIQELLRKLRTGQARIDEDSRLVGIEPNQPAQHQQADPLPPLPPPPRPNDENIGPAAAAAADNEDEELQWIQQMEREAAEAIERAVCRYEQQGVALEDLQLVRMRNPQDDERTNLTFRRICIAVLAVVTAFICIMLQTLPLFRKTKSTNHVMDKLMKEVLHLKPLEEHAMQCPGLNRDSNLTWNEALWQRLGGTISRDCSDGVLHIPSSSVIVKDFRKAAASSGHVPTLEPFITNELSVSWFLPCHAPLDTHVSSCYPGSPDSSNVCTAATNRCFRGVHDGLISQREVHEALRMGSNLISLGHDHFDIHFEPDYLQQRLSSVLHKLERLLHDQYHVEGPLEPVAFRVSAVAPMDGAGVPLYGVHSTNSLIQIFNRTNYIRYMEKSQRRNELAQYSLPWPFRIRPVRDTCNLLADLEADPRFAIHTSVFLSDGAGEEFRGGVALYVDHHSSNTNPRRKIRRGVTIDGTRGRVVVSTGGLENRRCRLPTRAGVRAVLQIWWNC